MNIHTEFQETEAILRLEGRMEYSVHRDFRNACEVALDYPTLATLILDLSLVDFMDSAALGMLLLIREKAVAKDLKVILRNPSPKILPVLKMVHFQKFFEIQT